MAQSWPKTRVHIHNWGMENSWIHVMVVLTKTAAIIGFGTHVKHNRTLSIPWTSTYFHGMPRRSCSQAIKPGCVSFMTMLNSIHWSRFVCGDKSPHLKGIVTSSPRVDTQTMARIELCPSVALGGYIFTAMAYRDERARCTVQCTKTQLRTLCQVANSCQKYALLLTIWPWFCSSTV